MEKSRGVRSGNRLFKSLNPRQPFLFKLISLQLDRIKRIGSDFVESEGGEKVEIRHLD